MRHLVFLIALTTSAGLMPGQAKAQSPSQESMDLVLESHVGARPRDADYLLAPLLDELRRSGLRGSSVAGTRIHSKHSVSSKELSSKQLAQVRQFTKDAHSAYLDFHFEGAISAAGRALSLLLSRPATMVKQQNVRDYLYEALILTSLANARLGNQPALKAAMGEFIRSFPKRDVSNKEYGPEGTDLYRKISRRMRAMKKGELQIAAAPGSMIFVNETYKGLEALKLQLVPGRYRIYIQNGAQSGRVHIAEVIAGRTHTLVVDPLMDKVLRTSGNMVGFVFPNEEARAKNEKRMALALGRALGAKKIVLVGFHKSGGKDSIVASSVIVESGESGASARVPLPQNGAPSAAQLRALAAFVAGSKPASPDIVVINSKNAPRAIPTKKATARPRPKALAQSHQMVDNESVNLKVSSDDSPSGGLSAAWRWTAWTAGAAGVGVGAYLIAIHGTGTCGEAVCRENYNTLAPGIGLVAGGAALGVLGYVLWGKEAGEEPTLVSVLPSAGGLRAAVSFRF